MVFEPAVVGLVGDIQDPQGHGYGEAAVGGLNHEPVCLFLVDSPATDTWQVGGGPPAPAGGSAGAARWTPHGLCMGGCRHRRQPGASSSSGTTRRSRSPSRFPIALARLTAFGHAHNVVAELSAVESGHGACPSLRRA